MVSLEHCLNIIWVSVAVHCYDLSTVFRKLPKDLLKQTEGVDYWTQLLNSFSFSTFVMTKSLVTSWIPRSHVRRYAATPVKYERDLKNPTNDFMISKTQISEKITNGVLMPPRQ